MRRIALAIRICAQNGQIPKKIGLKCKNPKTSSVFLGQVDFQGDFEVEVVKTNAPKEEVHIYIQFCID
jgi:hypothetical protein